MIRDITLGQYYDTQSPIHKMDPRTKILFTVFYMVTLFLIDGIYAYTAILLLTALIIALSNIPLKFMVKGLKFNMSIVVLMTLISQLFQALIIKKYGKNRSKKE